MTKSTRRKFESIRPSKNEADYEAALKEIDELFEADADTHDGDRLEVLVTLVEKYEEEVHPVPPPDPVSAIEYYLESRGLTRRELEGKIGSRGRISEIMNRKRPLTLRMIRTLHREFGIPAESLIGE